MLRKFCCFITLIIILVLVNITTHLSLGTIKKAQLVNIERPNRNWLTIVLLPLDSRPPCTQFIEQLAEVVNISIITPPTNLLDNYKTPGDKTALREWLQTAVHGADAAIVSVDMLIHGGLIASRHSLGTSGDVTAVLQLLKNIKQDNPHLCLFAFSIIPRLLIADSDENSRFQDLMLKFSVLSDQVTTFENSKDFNILQRIRQQIPSYLIERYLSLYHNNSSVNTELLHLVENEIVNGLVIGQDDGQIFGIANKYKQRLDYYVNKNDKLAGKVFITHGADEVALNILGHIALKAKNVRPRIFVMYSHDAAPKMIMPFMSHSVQTTVKEKIYLLGGIEAATLDEADFILYVHVGTMQTDWNSLMRAAHQIESFIQEGKKLAIVDLTEDYYASETLLPVLLKRNLDITKIIAYAGWNTASNSIGTALTQASLYISALHTKPATNQVYGLHQTNLEFTVARLLDDWFFQKDVQPHINSRLKAANLNPYNLGKYRHKTDSHISNYMASRSKLLLNQSLLHRSLTPQQNAPNKIIITGLDIETHLPWDRTFEIWLKPTLTFAEITE